jgi:hypothetical protein
MFIDLSTQIYSRHELKRKGFTMKRRRSALSACLVASSFFVLACNKEQPLGADADLAKEVSLEKDFGGFTASDEAPMFSDEEVLAESGEDESVIDPVNYDAATNLAAAAGFKAYVVRVAWGLLEGDSTATEVIDWSGSVRVSRGVLAVLKVIRFEREQGDHLQLPRTGRQELAFTSHTRTHYDGLALLIVDHDTANGTGELTIQAGGYARMFTFEELDSLNVVEPVGANGGNAASIISGSKEARPFVGGFLAGRWLKTDDRGGEFHGRWINGNGTNAGSLRGIWGVRRNGENVFFGKYVGMNGEFGGLLAGHWNYNDDHGGVFEGRWFNRDREESGKVAGHFKLGRDDGRGFFHGRWFKRG